MRNQKKVNKLAKLPAKDLQNIKSLRNSTEVAKLKAENAVALHRIAELECDNMIFKIYLRNNLTVSEHINEQTGEIVYNAANANKVNGDEDDKSSEVTESANS